MSEEIKLEDAMAEAMQADGLDRPPYPWIELKPVEIPGDMARSINRRIATQLQLRADIDTGKYTQSRLRPGSSPITEALRREVFIRRDTVQLLRFKNMDATDAEAALAAINQTLLEAL